MWVTAAVLLALPGLLAAQTPPVDPTGIRARLTFGTQRVTGVITAFTGDTIFLRAPATSAVSINDITRLEVSRGRHGFVGRGAVYGLAAGAVIGGLVTATGCLNGPCPDVAGLTIAYGLLGTATGAVSGAIFRTERWGTVMPSDWRATGPRRDTVIATIARGRHGHAGTGLLVGAMAGGLASLPFGIALEQEASSIDDLGVAVVVAGAAAGAIVGALIGAAIRTEHRRSSPIAGLRPQIGYSTDRGVWVGLQIKAR